MKRNHGKGEEGRERKKAMARKEQRGEERRGKRRGEVQGKMRVENVEKEGKRR